MSDAFVVGFAAGKGGTGKTTFSFNIGMEFARRRRWKGVGRRPVLLVDLDPQAIGGGEREGPTTTLARVFERGPFELIPLKIEGGKMVESRRVTKETVERTGGFELYRVRYSVDRRKFNNADPRCSVHDAVLLAHVSTHADEPDVNFGRLLDAVTGAGFDGIVILDTPPLNVQAAFVSDALRRCDLVVPVLSPECYDQALEFIRSYPVRFVIVNRVPRGNLKETERIKKEMRKYFRGTTLDRNDIIIVPNADVVQTCTNTGVPLRCRDPRPKTDIVSKFHVVALRVEMERERREIAKIGLTI